MKPISVLLVSTSYPQDAGDWRARFIADMVLSLAARDDVRLSVWAPPGNLPEGVRSALTADDRAFLAEMSAAGGIAHLMRRSKLKAPGYVLRLLGGLRDCYLREPCDLLHVNWLQNTLAIPGRDDRPVLTTVLGSDYRLLSLPTMRMLLRNRLKGRKVHIAPNAEWMVPRLNEAFGDIASVSAIPFGIEPSWYALERTEEASESKQWLTVSRITRGKIGDLFAWGEQEFSGQFRLHLLGPLQEKELSIPQWVEHHGPTCPEELRSRWFPNAAGLISLSRHDEGRPQVMLEAMAAGLPIIASDLPAHRDIILHGKTGFIVNSREELRDALHALAQPDVNRSFGAAARETAMQRYGTWHDCASRYRVAYAKLMGS